MKKITIVGGGNLGAALALGMPKNGNWQVTVTGRKAARLAPLSEAGLDTTTDNEDAVRDADWVILCVQPGQVAGVLREMASVLKPGQQHLISTATGVSLEALRSHTPEGMAWVRAMPNTASAIQESITCLSGQGLTDEQWAEVEQIFACIGATLRIDEPMMQAATVLG
ncbi:MAG TPA: pyrroline-5-carboxylate reductase, partial [Cytophagales bacterium]|nr:pyrroline-5-carboxylate reductase [Cytophagales bacterium]